MRQSRILSNTWIGSMTVVAFLCAMTTLLVAATVGPAADAQSPSGPEVFAAHCASCHQAGGEGIVGTFPPLAGNPAAADAAYVESVIRDGQTGPIEVLGTTYDAVMPPVVALSDPEIAAVVDYVVELAGSAATSDEEAAPSESEVDAAVESVVGDVERGRLLFAGSQRFDGGTPACGSCHVAGSVGEFGGGVLGPDLTGSFETLGGETGLTSWLGNPPSATMAPIFAERPLTEAELADVVAFLGDAPSQERPDSGFDRILAVVVVGLVAAIALMAMTGARIRKPYLAKLRSAR